MVFPLLFHRQASGFLAKFTLDDSEKIVVVMNNHFVARKEDASCIIATFNEGKNEIKTVELDPEIFFRTNQVTKKASEWLTAICEIVISNDKRHNV